MPVVARLDAVPGEGAFYADDLMAIRAGAQHDGFAYVGDLKQVVWYTSGDVNVSVGTTGTQFIENERTILAETEGITGVVGAAAIIKADLTA